MFIAIKRKKIYKFRKSKFKTSLMLENFIKNFADKDKIIISSHITSPFLKIKTLKMLLKK